jgi:hypothetical protein
VGWRRKRKPGDPSGQLQQTHPFPPFLLPPPSRRRTRPSTDTCARAFRMQTRSSAKRVTRQSARTTRGTSPHPSSVTTPHPPTLYATHGPQTSGSQLPNSSMLYFVSPVPKRPLDQQEEAPEPKRRRTVPKRSGPTAPGTETQSSSSSLTLTDDESELVALRRTLQQVQHDLSALQQDQQQLDDITRGIQHDLDEAQPRETLRFLEEHFTCAL